MYVVMFGMACIEGAGLCMASLHVDLHCLWERDMHASRLCGMGWWGYMRWIHQARWPEVQAEEYVL